METIKAHFEKDEFVQFLRGISIIAVILIHCKTGMESESIELWYWIILRQILNFSVPMFFSISAYFSMKQFKFGIWGGRDSGNYLFLIFFGQ